MNEQELRDLVRSTLTRVMGDPAFDAPPAGSTGPARPSQVAAVDPGEIPDIRAVDYRQVYAVPNPANPEGFQRIKATTWARLGQGRCGPRYTTAAVLRFLADNATAMDAVFNDVSDDVIARLGLFSVQTVCQSRDDFLTYPDKGAQFDPAVLAEIKAKCQPNPQVQVFVADGLSSTAVEANVPALLPAFEQGLKLKGLTMGTPFFVKYGRVRSMEPISEALGATVTCVLIGERPGLATAESLSAYLAYQARVGMSEALRTCLSNIHREGTNAAEAGAHLAELAAEIIRQKASGIDLQTA